MKPYHGEPRPASHQLLAWLKAQGVVLRRRAFIGALDGIKGVWFYDKKNDHFRLEDEYEYPNHPVWRHIALWNEAASNGRYIIMADGQDMARLYSIAQANRRLLDFEAEMPESEIFIFDKLWRVEVDRWKKETIDALKMGKKKEQQPSTP
jgi:hypothetical protein